MENKLGRQGAKSLVGIQCALILIIARFADITYGLPGFISAVLGGLTYIIPNTLFAWIIFGKFRIIYAKQYVKRVYRGEAFKVLLTMLMFAMVFYFAKNILPLVFFMSFLVVQCTIWITPWIFMLRERNR